MKVTYLLLPAFLTVSCGGSSHDPKNVYEIGSCGSDQHHLEGIPFYAVTYEEVTTAHFKQEIFKLALEEKVADHGLPLPPVYTDDRDLASCVLGKLRASDEKEKAKLMEIINGEGCDGTMQNVPPMPLSCGDFTDKEPFAKTKSVEKSIEPVRRCINVNYPKKGTTTAKISLNDDGLLTGAEASVEAQSSSLLKEVFSTVVEAMPFGGIFEKVLGIKNDDKMHGVPPFVPTGKLVVTPEIQARVYTRKGDNCDNFTVSPIIQAAEAKEGTAK